jgi:hypothetical protein
MDPRLLDSLRNAPSVDLYELNLMVTRLLADPVRILDVRKRLHLGAQVMFFDHRTNALMPGRAIELRQKDLCVQEDGKSTIWILPYAAIVIESTVRAAQPAPPPNAPINATDFNVGDTVCFTDKYLRERVGTVIRLNDKTLSVSCDGERWRVTRRILRKMIDV